MASFLSNLYQFSRPHTIPATMMAIVYQFASVGGFSSSSSSSLSSSTNAYAVLAMSLLKWELVVLFIVGINQIYDVDIDRINKTYLPLASGGFSMAMAQLITYGSLVGSLALALYQQDPVSLALVCVCLLIGTAYSVPQLRFKSSQTLAGVSIVLARGLLVNLAEYGIFHRAVHGSDGINASNTISIMADMASMASASASVLESHTVDILICVAHASLFTAAVAIAKDLPDMDGDRKFKIQTFALTYGWRAVGAVTVSLIALGIVVPMGLTLVYKPSLSGSVQSVYVAVAGVVIAELVRRARALKAPDATTLSAFYHGTIWPVFYANFAAVTVLQAASAGAFTQ